MREGDIEITKITMSLPSKLPKNEVQKAKIDIIDLYEEMEEEASAYVEGLKPLNRAVKNLQADIAQAAHRRTREAGGIVAGLREQLERAEDKLDEYQKGHKLNQASLEVKAKRLTSMINTEMSYAPVECEIRKDFRSKQVVTIRKDLGEVVEERAMTQDELQMGIAVA